MEEYEKKHDHAVSEKETDIPKLTDLLLKVGTQQFLETLSPYITGGEIFFDGDDAYGASQRPALRSKTAEMRS